MPWWLVLLGFLLAALLGWLVVDWLLGEAQRAVAPDTRATLRIDAIRTGLTVVVGTGGGLALLLAARRQWISERAQRHLEAVAAGDQRHRDRVQDHAETVADTTRQLQERQARAAEHDATERRVTELYTRAVELLGDDKAAVRLGGLYALERLGQGNPEHQATIGAVLCAYLRMPPPGDDPRETEVRLTAQRLLTRHLRPADEAAYWPRLRLELTGARLHDFDASGCALVDADFTGAEFTGRTTFAAAVVTGRLSLGARFAGATFDGLGGDGDVVLDGARFTGPATFEQARFGGEVSCSDAVFTRASFAGSVFGRPASFHTVRFAEEVSYRGAALDRVTFEQAVFGGAATFEEARFDGEASWHGAVFGEVTFGRSVFAQPATFDNTRFGAQTSFRQASFHGGLSMDRAEFWAYAGFRLVRFARLASFRWAVFRDECSFEGARFDGKSNFGRARFHGPVTFSDARWSRPPLVAQARAAAAGGHVWPDGVATARVDDDWLVLVDP